MIAQNASAVTSKYKSTDKFSQLQVTNEFTKVEQSPIGWANGIVKMFYLWNILLVDCPEGTGIAKST